MLNLEVIKAIAVVIILECHAAFESLAWYVLSPSHEVYGDANLMVMNAFRPFADLKWSKDAVKAASWRLAGWISFWRYQYK